MASTENPKGHKRTWKWVGIAVLLSVVTLVIVGDVVLHHAGPILKGRVEETLSTRFDSRVTLQTLDVSIFRGLEVSGSQLLIYPPESVVAAGVGEPLIAIDRFQFHSGILGLFFKPMHIRSVHVTGLTIHIPPREKRLEAPEKGRKRKGKIKMTVEQITVDDSHLIIGTSNPDKDPRDYELKKIVMNDVGPNAPWKYDAVLTNAIPRGEIHSKGSFGPWQTETPGDSSVNGHYTFEHADLNTIKGLGGILSSVGEFTGQLDKIAVNGTTETPDFSLDTANHPLALHTKFSAIVDGTTGDTYLESIDAKLRNSSFKTSGTVINIKGKGHRIKLDVDVPAGQLQDFLDLAVKTEPPVMNAVLGTKTKLEIRPGKESVTQKLSFTGTLTLKRIHFTNPKVQDKVDMLSLRAQGDPKQAKPGAADVNSRMLGRFQMSGGVIRFSQLSYVLPGARINLVGLYSMDGQHFDFYGKVLTNASLSQMVSSRWASLLLKPVSPFFHRSDGKGTEIPVSIKGTKSAPKFGLDLFGHHGDKKTPAKSGR